MRLSYILFEIPLLGSSLSCEQLCRSTRCATRWGLFVAIYLRMFKLYYSVESHVMRCIFAQARIYLYPFDIAKIQMKNIIARNCWYIDPVQYCAAIIPSHLPLWLSTMQLFTTKGRQKCVITSHFGWRVFHIKPSHWPLVTELIYIQCSSNGWVRSWAPRESVTCVSRFLSTAEQGSTDSGQPKAIFEKSCSDLGSLSNEIWVNLQHTHRLYVLFAGVLCSLKPVGFFLASWNTEKVLLTNMLKRHLWTLIYHSTNVLSAVH